MEDSTINTVIDYWNRRPCNLHHSVKEVGTKEYFDEVEKRKYFVEYHIPKFADFVNWKGKKVLEVGCGIGTDAINFARHGCEYSGIELSDKSLELTEQRFKIYNLEGKFYNFNAEDNQKMMALGEETFDLVYSFGVIHHSPNPSHIISNLYKLLKPGGVFKLMLYATNSWKKFLINTNKSQFEAQVGCPIANTYTHTQVKDLLKEFDDIQIDQQHIFPYKIEAYKRYEYIKEDWFEAMPKELFDILETKLGWHLCITCKRNI